jgi:hypothetical protein
MHFMSGQWTVSLPRSAENSLTSRVQTSANEDLALALARRRWLTVLHAGLASKPSLRCKEQRLLSRAWDRYHSKGILADAPLARQDRQVLCNEAAGEKESMRKKSAKQRAEEVVDRQREEGVCPLPHLLYHLPPALGNLGHWDPQIQSHE